jgi:hypothetical protein
MLCLSHEQAHESTCHCTVAGAAPYPAPGLTLTRAGSVLPVAKVRIQGDDYDVQLHASHMSAST